MGRIFSLYTSYPPSMYGMLSISALNGLLPFDHEKKPLKCQHLDGLVIYADYVTPYEFKFEITNLVKRRSYCEG